MNKVNQKGRRRMAALASINAPAIAVVQAFGFVIVLTMLLKM